MKQTKPCSRCDGKGTVWIFSENPNPSSMYFQSKCVWCDGKGEVIKERKKDWAD